MTPWTRWRTVVLATVLPAWRPGLPDAGTAADPTFWRAFAAAAPLSLRLGLVVAILYWTWRPLLTCGRPLHRLPAGERNTWLEAHVARSGWLVEQLALVVKIVAAFAVFRHPAARDDLLTSEGGAA